MKSFCYFNGRIVPEKKIGLSVRDLGVLRGYGVFDLLRTYSGKPFLFNEHFARFVKSARVLGLEVPISRAKAAVVVDTLLKRNGYAESTVRFVLTGGPAADGIHFNPAAPTFFVLISPFYPLADSLYRKGVALRTHEHLREFPSVKSLNYLTAVRLHNPEKGKQPFEVLYTWQGRILEAPTSNFFIFKGNALVTPRRDVLVGTIRNLVMQLARRAFQVRERDVFVRELSGAREAFLTATNKEIVPVVAVDGRRIGNGRVGERTKRLMGLFAKRRSVGVR